LGRIVCRVEGRGKYLVRAMREVRTLFAGGDEVFAVRSRMFGLATKKVVRARRVGIGTRRARNQKLVGPLRRTWWFAQLWVLNEKAELKREESKSEEI